MSAVLPARLDWPSAIGLFIMNYGVLDWHVFVFLETSMDPGEFAKITNEPFQDRINRVKTFVNEPGFPFEQKQDFARFFARLEPVRKLRNHIAHGYLLVQTLKGGETVVKLSLPKDLNATSAAETRHLDLKELIDALRELRDLIEEFSRLSAGRSS